MPSATTMELSTIIPIAMIRAPSDMRWRGIPKIERKTRLPRMVKTKPVPMMTPIRQPMGIVITARTMTTACNRLIKKPSMDSFTRSDCQAIFSTSMPMGSCCHDLGKPPVDVAADVDDVAVFGSGQLNRQRRLAVETHQAVGRVEVSGSDRRNVLDPDQLVDGVSSSSGWPPWAWAARMNRSHRRRSAGL